MDLSQTSATEAGRINSLWRGELGLAKTYWLFGVLVTVLLSLPSTMLLAAYYPFESLEGPGEPVSGLMALYKVLYMTSALAAGAYWLIIIVPIWRSASRYKGPQIWAFLAKAAAIFGVLRFLGSLGGLVSVA